MTHLNKLYRKFFGPIVPELEGRGFKLVSGRYDSYSARGFFADEIRFRKEIRYGIAFNFNMKEVRVELIIDRKDAKGILDKLRESRSSIEAKLALGDLRWDRKSGRQRTRIAAVQPGTTIENIEDDLEDIRQWAIRCIVRFKKVFDPLLLDIVKDRP